MCTLIGQFPGRILTLVGLGTEHDFKGMQDMDTYEPDTTVWASGSEQPLVQIFSTGQGTVSGLRRDWNPQRLSKLWNRGTLIVQNLLDSGEVLEKWLAKVQHWLIKTFYLNFSLSAVNYLFVKFTSLEPNENGMSMSACPTHLHPCISLTSMLESKHQSRFFVHSDMHR